MLGGCSYDTKKVMQLYSTGQVEAAADLACSSKLKKPDKRNELIWLIEKGKILHDAGRFQQSNAAFAQADALLEKFDAMAKTRLSQELGAALADQTIRDYEGTAADRIFVSTYESLNYLALAEFEEARVHARRAHDRQKEALDLHAKALAKAQKAFENDWKNKYKATTQPNVPISPTDEGLALWLNPAYADYANPVASYLSALLSLGEGDISNAEVDLRKVMGMVPQNRFLQEEWKAVYHPSDEQVVYVLFESGLAPALREKKYRYATPWTGYSAMALPSICFSDCEAKALALSGTGVNCRTEPLASVNSIVAADFNGRFGTIMFRTVTSLLVKEAAVYAAREAARRSDQQRARQNGKSNDRLGEALVLLGGSVWKAVTSNADLRTWQTLPAQVQLARFYRPKDGIVNLSLVTDGPAPGATAVVQVPDTKVTLLLVRSINREHVSCHVAPLTPVEQDVMLAADATAAATPSIAPGR